MFQFKFKPICAFCMVMMLFLAFPAGAWERGKVSEVKTIMKDIAYAQDSTTQKLDIYLPNEGEGPFPLVVYLHGGGWESGSKSGGPVSVWLSFVNAGYAVASVDYRLSGEAIWPAQIYDCKAAVRFLRANASAYKLDPDQIAVCGSSAGGHLAALMGTSNGVAALEDLSMGNQHISSDVQAVIDWYGVTDFDTLIGMENYVGKVEQFPVGNPIVKLFGSTSVADLARPLRQASPVTHVSKGMPPFLIQHGTKDMTVPFSQSVSLYNKIKESNGESSVFIRLIEGATHGQDGFYSDETVEQCHAFLNQFIKKSATPNEEKLLVSTSTVSTSSSPTPSENDGAESAVEQSGKEEITVLINGVKLQFEDQKPIIKNGTTLVPLRALFEGIGAKVTYDDATSEVTVVKGLYRLKFTVGSSDLNINGHTVTMKQPVEVQNNRTMIPLRVMTEALGAKVEWNEKTMTVSITMIGVKVQ